MADVGWCRLIQVGPAAQAARLAQQEPVGLGGDVERPRGRLCVLGDLRRRRLVVEGPLVGQLDDLGRAPRRRATYRRSCGCRCRVWRKLLP